MDGDRLRRRDVLRGIGGATTAGMLGVGAVGSAAAAPTLGPRTGSNGREVFLGGDFFELGVRADGSFGTDTPAPDDFYGSQRVAYDSRTTDGAIGMYADYDGFDAGSNTQGYDYFLPGNPEERFSVGYVLDGEPRTASNGNTAGEAMPTTPPTAQVLGTELRSEFSSTFDDLRIDQTYSFENSNQFFRVDVTVENTGDATLDSVRYQRSVDPDNARDFVRQSTTEGCEFYTTNSVISQPPTSNEALVSAAVPESGCQPTASVPPIPIFYYSTDTRARVSTGTEFSLSPNPVVYDPPDYDSPQAEGTVVTSDTYIAITFDFGELGPGDSVSTTYYTALTDDVDTTREEIVDEPREPEPEDVPDNRGAEFSLVCDERGCIEEATDGNERVTLSNSAPAVGEEIELAVTVTNVGDASGAYFGELTDGFRSYGTRRVVLDEDETTTLTYTLSFEKPGLFQMFLTGDHVVDVPVGLPFDIFSL